MFDIGWSEMAIIALVALVILGPKELPQAMRAFANFSKKMQKYAREFRSGIDNIVREAELEDARKAIQSVRSVNPTRAISKWADPSGEVTAEVKDVEAAARGDASEPSSSPTPPTEEDPRIVRTPAQIAPPHSLKPPVVTPAAAPAPAPAAPATAPAPKSDDDSEGGAA